MRNKLPRSSLRSISPQSDVAGKFDLPQADKFVSRLHLRNQSSTLRLRPEGLRSITARNKQTRPAFRQAGFTLIELLVVIAVVGILSAAVISGINPTQRFKEARDSQRKTIVGTLATAMEACYTKNGGSYTTPTDCTSLNTLYSQGYVKADYTSYDVTTNAFTSTGNVFTAAAGCVATKLEAPTSPNTHWKWLASTGTAAEATSACP